jgi:hypothetical protein
MSKALTVKKISEIPADILELWGKPPVLPNEDLKAYRKLSVAVADATEPVDIIEWLSVRDIVYHHWQIRRLHVFKDELIKIGQSNLSRDYCEKSNITEEEKTRAVRKYFRATDRGTTMGFRQDPETYETIGSQLAAEEARLNALLREFDKRREGLAAHARTHFRASDDIIDGEFTEPHLASAASLKATKSGVVPDSYDPGQSASGDSKQVKKNNLVKKGTQMSPARVSELLEGS